MNTIKIILGIILALASISTLFQTLGEESGAGLGGALFGFVLISGLSLWLIITGIKKK